MERTRVNTRMRKKMYTKFQYFVSSDEESWLRDPIRQSTFFTERIINRTEYEAHLLYNANYLILQYTFIKISSFYLKIS